VPGPTDFAAVDAGDARELVAMMDATDAWPAVQAARAWVLQQAGLVDGAVVLDVGCGPGTFCAAVDGCAIDVDRSQVMLQEVRRRRPAARTVVADLTQLPLRDAAAHVVHVERVLQWSDDPSRALAELARVTAPVGWLAVTDTDWGTFELAHLDSAAAARVHDAAVGWVPNARFARDLPATIAALGARDVRTRRDTVTITAWDPDDPEQRDGPPGLPLHSIAGPHAGDLEVVAERARGGSFQAQVNIVTCIARW
jgi:SAM-dependent methyltransferase